jgi:hypothetical protein
VAERLLAVTVEGHVILVVVVVVEQAVGGGLQLCAHRALSAQGASAVALSVLSTSMSPHGFTAQNHGNCELQKKGI